MLTIAVPLPPSANALTCLAGRRRVSTAAYRGWTEQAKYIVTTAWRAAGRPTFAPPLSLTIEANLPSRRRDLSNVIKPIEDMLVKAIDGLPDDRWNDDVHARRSTVPAAGTALVTIRPAPS